MVRRRGSSGGGSSGANGMASKGPILDSELARESNQRGRQKHSQMEIHSWSCGRFGLRWNPKVDLLNVPDVAGVYVLFFEGEQRLVGSAPNVFRRIMQSWYAPGRSIVAFSWMEVVPYEGKDFAVRMLRHQSYEELWNDIRPPTQREDADD